MRHALATALALLAACSSAAVEAKGFAAFTTRDGGKLVRWYASTFDLRPVATVRPEDANATLTVLSGEIGTVEILARPEIMQAPSAASSRIGIFKAGFAVDKLEPWLKRWESMDVPIVSGPMGDPQAGTRAVIIRDPDGNLVQLIETPAP